MNRKGLKNTIVNQTCHDIKGETSEVMLQGPFNKKIVRKHVYVRSSSALCPIRVNTSFKANIADYRIDFP